MSDTSLLLGLPYIQAAQAQKHVTHNEAIRALDLIVQGVVQDRTRATPPTDPAAGDRHIVGADASGDWNGREGQIALFDNNLWQFTAPQPGWGLRVLAENTTVYFDGTTWATDTPDTIETVGINTTADTTNRLSVSAPATLLNNEGAGHQLKINKAAEADTASLLFQTNWSGRAEMGTTGSDDFAIKTSGDGTTWNTSTVYDSATGRASFPSGARVSNRTDIGGRFYCYPDNRWMTHSITYGIATENHNSACGTGTSPNLDWAHMGAFMQQGSILKSLDGFLRVSSDEITGVDVEIHYQTGPLDTGWDTETQVQRTFVVRQFGVPMTTGMNHLSLDLAQFEIPQDGQALLFLRPIGTLTGLHYIYAVLSLRYLSSD